MNFPAYKTPERPKAPLKTIYLDVANRSRTRMSSIILRAFVVIHSLESAIALTLMGSMETGLSATGRGTDSFFRSRF